MKKTIFSLLIGTLLLSSCGDEADILVPVNIPGENFTGRWAGGSNYGTMKLINLKFVKDPNLSEYKISGNVTLAFFNDTRISSGEFKPTDNTLVIRGNKASNFFTVKGTYKPEEDKFNGTWTAMGNTGTWYASKDN